MNNCAVILAGGEGTRMKSAKPKVMAELLFRPMIDWVYAAAKQAGVEDICVVTGYRAEVLEEHLAGRAQTVRQTERLGTGHAVMQAAEFIKSHSGANVLILNGDAPLIDAGTISGALDYHIANGFSETVISAKVPNPFGYGRIVRDENGNFTAITEEASATEEIKKINEINSGAIWFNADALTELLGKITNNNSKHEYYLTDTVGIASVNGMKVGAYISENPDAVLGANSQLQLHELNEIIRMRILNRLMLDGVSIPCTDGVIIEGDAVFGKDTVILPGTVIKSGCSIGSDCHIGPGCILQNTKVGDGSTLQFVKAENKDISEGTVAGPYVTL